MLKKSVVIPIAAVGRRSSPGRCLQVEAGSVIDRAEAWFEEESGPLGKTIDEILSHEGSKPNHTISGAIAWRIAQKIDARGERSLTEAERRFGAVDWLEAEVNNGGFDQYFFNSAGNYAAAALAGRSRSGPSCAVNTPLY